MSFNPYEFDRDMVPEGQIETLGQYTAKTFLWMVLGLLITFGVAIACWLTGVVAVVWNAQLILLIATLAIAFTMGARIERMQVGTARVLFIVYAVLFGLTMSIYLVIFDFMSLIFVFLATAVYFGALAGYGYLTHRNLSGLRPLLIFGLLFLLLFEVVMMVIPGFHAADQIVCLAGMAIFLAFTAYDVQKIKGFYQYYSGYPDMLEKASIFSALQLYLDFLNLFLYLLRFLGGRKR